MSILRAVGGEEEEAGGGEALDERIEHRLRLSIDPVEVLDDEQQGLPLALPQQQALHGVQGALAALGGLDRLPLRIIDRYIQEPEERWRGGGEGVIKAAEFGSYLLTHRRQRLAILKAEVAFEQVDDWEIGGGLAVGRPLCLQDQPRRREGTMDELIAQA